MFYLCSYLFYVTHFLADWVWGCGFVCSLSCVFHTNVCIRHICWCFSLFGMSYKKPHTCHDHDYKYEYVSLFHLYIISRTNDKLKSPAFYRTQSFLKLFSVVVKLFTYNFSIFPVLDRYLSFVHYTPVFMC